MDMQWNHWKVTAIAMALVVVTAVISGLVVASWRGGETGKPDTSATTSAAPAPAPAPAPAASPQLDSQATARPAPTPQRVAGPPPQSAIEACNQYAANQTGSGPATKKEKTIDVVKDAAIGAVGGAAVGALGGAVAGGGKGAGKGAAIGGVLGGGGGTLYGIYQNKQNDEKYRTAYSGCMREKGYTVASASSATK